MISDSSNCLHVNEDNEQNIGRHTFAVRVAHIGARAESVERVQKKMDERKARERNIIIFGTNEIDSKAMRERDINDVLEILLKGFLRLVV